MSPPGSCPLVVETCSCRWISPPHPTPAPPPYHLVGSPPPALPLTQEGRGSADSPPRGLPTPTASHLPDTSAVSGQSLLKALSTGREEQGGISEGLNTASSAHTPPSLPRTAQQKEKQPQCWGPRLKP